MLNQFLNNCKSKEEINNSIIDGITTKKETTNKEERPMDALHPVTFPLISNGAKFYKEQIQSPIVFAPLLHAPGEEFRFVTDVVLPNVMQYRYMVSNLGRIYDCYLHRFMTPVFNGPNNTGYVKTKFAYYKDPMILASKDVYFHRVVMMTFNPVEGMENLEVDHRNGVKTDNMITNLRWVSNKQNVEYASKYGLIKSGEDHPRTYITDREATDICRALARGSSIDQIAKVNAIPKYIIYDIKEGRSFRNISKQYDFSKGDEIRRQVTHKPNTLSPTLPDDKVHEICKRLERGDRIIDICRDLGVARYVVNDIKAGRNYVSISSQYKMPKRTLNILDDETVEIICQYLEEGMSPINIARKLSVSKEQVQSIKSGATYKYISQKYNIGKPGDKFISDETAKQICDLLETRKYTCGQVGNMTYTTKSIVEGIYYRRSYKRISEDYTFWKK